MKVLMGLSVDDDIKDIEKHIGKLNENLITALSSSTAQAADIIRNESIRGIQTGQRSGIKYLVGTSASGRRSIRQFNPDSNVPPGMFVHQASAPGEYPKALDGGLTASINISKENDFEYNVGTNLSYGVGFENGTRPFLSRALEENTQKIQDVFFQNITEALDK